MEEKAVQRQKQRRKDTTKVREQRTADWREEGLAGGRRGTEEREQKGLVSHRHRELLIFDRYFVNYETLYTQPKFFSKISMSGLK